MVWVLPGLEEVCASAFLSVRRLISEDLPTLERPIKANSGSSGAGHCDSLDELLTKVADLIFNTGGFRNQLNSAHEKKACQ